MKSDLKLKENKGLRLRQSPAHSYGPCHARSSLFLILAISLLFLVYSISTSSREVVSWVMPSLGGLTKYSVLAATPLLRVIQVYPPVLTASSNGTDYLTDGSKDYVQAGTPSNGTSCVTQQTLVEHVFRSSYGKPFIGSYSPPSCDFNHVTFNLTVTAAGKQFDRLGYIYFGDVEIWRTSTAEPTQSGIVWTYIKDMSHYIPLFREPQKLIFDLPNNVDSTYTSPLNVSLEAAFFTADVSVEPASMIVPISSHGAADNNPSAWLVPPSNATNTLTLPRNIRRAVISIAATGQIDEEFWYSNVLSSETRTFPGTLLGYSPFREVQLYIDGMLAGVVWPFPVIFTGGLVPGFWRPVVGIDAFDLKEDEIDITPWLPLLCDGSSHRYDIKIAGLRDGGKGDGTITQGVGSFWVVSGKIFVFQDAPGSITIGSMPKAVAPAPSISLSSSIGKSSNGSNETLAYNVGVSRQFEVSSNLSTADGQRQATWSQRLDYSNHNVLINFGSDQLTVQSSSGEESSSLGYARRFHYPLNASTSIFEGDSDNTLSINGSISRGQDILIAGQTVFPNGLHDLAKSRNQSFQGSHLQTSQDGNATYLRAGGNYSGTGQTHQNFQFEGIRLDGDQDYQKGVFRTIVGSSELFQREVLASNDSFVQDESRLHGRSVSGIIAQAGLSQHGYAGAGPMAMVGRAPRILRHPPRKAVTKYQHPMP